ncbi:MAG: hydrogenase expression/formation protein [Burkholderiales bacterium]|nr:hydrogenase expression/formation protein [Burkholderiales bacterium]
MKEFPLPVRAIGPGSQPVEESELQYLQMPQGMNTFSMPVVPERADAVALRGAYDVLAQFLERMRGWDPGSAGDGPQIDLGGLPSRILEVVDEMLGEGEVSIRIGGDRSLHIQESVFTGLWRVCTLDAAGMLASDRLEAGPLPRVVTGVARAAASAAPPLVPLPPGAMNSPALLAEIASQMAERVDEAPAHVINLTLFPLTPDDHLVLEQALPVGPVAMISRGFGNCHITSTRLRDVWRVQYFNSMKTLILNTVEIIDVPVVALAAPEDLEESRERLAELVDWIGESCADVAQR